MVGSAARSDRFLWDLRRLVADEVGDSYVAGLREVSNRYGFKTWLENYGHWGFPSEFLKYGADPTRSGASSGSPAGSARGDARRFICGHTYGKAPVPAEAWTSGGAAWTLDPWGLKERGDWALTRASTISCCTCTSSSPPSARRG